MKIKYVLIIILLGFVVLGLVAGATSTQSNAVPATSSFDMHNINAQIFGNKNVTNGIPSYLTNQSKTGVMPDSLLITVRSPGASNFTLTVMNANGSNATHPKNSAGVTLQDFHFTNITTQYFTIPTSSNETFLIIISSPSYYKPVTFIYHADVKTAIQFINYETSKAVKPTVSNKITTTEGFLIFGIPAGVAMLPAYEISMFYVHTRRSHPNLDDKLVGGNKI